MTHRLKIGVSKTPPDAGIVSCRRIDLRERLLRFLLGEKRRLTILVPGDSVKSLSIEEEGGDDNDENDEAR
jgi:hypothetical protein